MTPACDQCRFFHRRSDPTGERKPIDGECRRHPPLVGEMLGDRICRDDRLLAAFPRVLISDWCGEFESVGKNGAETI